MRHDEERPRTSGFLSDGALPGHWTQVLAEMRTNAFSHLRFDEIRAEAAHMLIVAPSPTVAEACFSELLAETSSVETPSVEVIGPEVLVAERVPAGTWVFLPHRQDGWSELEETSERLRRVLVKDNSAREAADRLTLIEYGVNLWTWAEPPSSGGDPVCHAGELISWESAWALGPAGGAPAGEGGPSGVAASAGEVPPGEALAGEVGPASVRPPIYFGLPPVLRTRRWNS